MALVDQYAAVWRNERCDDEHIFVPEKLVPSLWECKAMETQIDLSSGQSDDNNQVTHSVKRIRDAATKEWARKIEVYNHMIRWKQFSFLCFFAGITIRIMSKCFGGSGGQSCENINVKMVKTKATTCVTVLASIQKRVLSVIAVGIDSRNDNRSNGWKSIWFDLLRSHTVMT